MVMYPNNYHVNEKVSHIYESCLTGAAYTFGVFLDPLEVEMGGGHSKVGI